MRPSSRLMKGTAAGLFACLILTGCEEKTADKLAITQAQQQPASTPETQIQQIPTISGQPATKPLYTQANEPHFEESEVPKVPKILGEELRPQEPQAEKIAQQVIENPQVPAVDNNAPQANIAPNNSNPEPAPMPQGNAEPQSLQSQPPNTAQPSIAAPDAVEPEIVAPQPPASNTPAPKPDTPGPEIQHSVVPDAEQPEVSGPITGDRGRLEPEIPDSTGIGDPEPLTTAPKNTSPSADSTELPDIGDGDDQSEENTFTEEPRPGEKTKENSPSAKPNETNATFVSLVDAKNSQTKAAEVMLKDEHSEVKLVRELTKAKGADLEVEIAGEVYGTKFEKEVSLLAFEFGDDCSEALQQALNIAGERSIGVSMSPTQKYVITKRISIPKGVTYLDGKGASIDVNTGANEANPTSTFEFVRGAKGTTITDFSLDLADSPFTRGIAAVAVQDITMSKITMTGLSYRGIEMAADGGDLKNIKVENNRIENIKGEKETKGQVVTISVNSEREDPDDRFKNSPSPIWDRYASDGTVSPNKYENSGISIIGNEIYGGYYGISFSGVSDSVIRDNKVTANTRNISMQNNCNNNIVEHNDLSNSYSSSVHIAYNSNNNQVQNNSIFSEVSHGQGLLQAYQDSDANTFTGNSVTIVGENQPSWILYVGPDSDNNKFLHNTIDGAARRAVVGVESIWDGLSAESNLNGESTNLHSYMSNGVVESPVDKSKVTYGGGRGAINNVAVEENVFTPRNAQTPLIYIGAEVTGGRIGNERLIGDIKGVSLANNTIVGSAFSDKLKTHTGELPEIGKANIEFVNDTVGEQKTN
ncbi:right-handed parallel beta-helix repeat-containing protein [Corynebacterium freiburgense]|uniref:right-handed parallel beta-helix repeat-containing protein n=1 Tax=Corynebacterium freiburgense TaxID=556548 RepID=UPI000420FB5B|nr:right-handed parallel beta-helix repeat-containing protein [Corynebacterium freiburgense]WJZ03768.1 hypothetical protein CFREI_12555 [Corynebacterium freiburgense]